MSINKEIQPQNTLIKMANEIAYNIAPTQTQEQVAKAMVDHLTRFWARSMKNEIINCLDIENHQLSETAELAIRMLKTNRENLLT
jgi:formate dehydrogenase subunit delta